MIGKVDVKIQSQNPEAPLYPLKAFVNSPSSLRICNVPERIGKWKLTRIYVMVSYPDGQVLWADTIPYVVDNTSGIWVCTIEGCSMSGKSDNGYAVYADGIDENGNPVTGYILGYGEVEVLEADETITPHESSIYVHLLSAFPLSGCPDGNMAPFEGGYGIMQGGEVRPLGASGNFLPLSGGTMNGVIGWDYGGEGGPTIHGPFNPETLDFSTTYSETSGNHAYLDIGRIQDESGQATIAYLEDLSGIQVPTKLSELSNDVGYTTDEDVYGIMQPVQDSITTLSNDMKGYIPLSVDSPVAAQITGGNTAGWEFDDQNGSPIFKIDEYGAYFSKRADIYGELYYKNQALSDYIDGKLPSVPDKLSQLSNDVGYITDAALSDYLPLSGGYMSGSITWDYGGMGGPQIYGPYTPQELAFTTTYEPDAQKIVFLDFSRITESTGQRTIAFVEDIDAVLGDLSALIHAT